MNSLIQGIIVGFCIAAPTGPVAILCIRRTLQFGRISGYFSALGSTIAETIYGGMAAFSLSFVSGFFDLAKQYLYFFGGLILLYLGYHLITDKKPRDVKASHTTMLGDLVSSMLVTLANPFTLLAFLAIFSGLSVSGEAPYFLTLGVLIGAASWWLLLAECAARFRHKINNALMMRINRIAGAVVFILGLTTLGLLLV